MSDTVLTELDDCLFSIESLVGHTELLLLDLPKELSPETRLDLHKRMLALHTCLTRLTQVLDKNDPVLLGEFTHKWAYRIQRDVAAASTMSTFIHDNIPK